MTNWLDLLCYAVGGGMLATMMFGIALAALMPTLDKWNKRYFILLFSMLLLSVAVFFTDIVIYRFPGAEKAEKIIVFFEFLSVSLLMPTPSVLLLHWCGERVKGSPLFCTELALWGFFSPAACRAVFGRLLQPDAG